MADLYVDFGALERSRATIADIEDLLGRSCRAMRDLPAEAAGVERLVSKLRDFGDEWDYGIGKLGEFSGSCGDALQAAVKAFTELDEELARSFDKDAQ